LSLDLAAPQRGTLDLQGMADAKIHEIDGRIAHLETMRAELSAVKDSECASMTDCSCGLGRQQPFVEIVQSGDRLDNGNRQLDAVAPVGRMRG
jgi:hypothetical protein